MNLVIPPSDDLSPSESVEDRLRRERDLTIRERDAALGYIEELKNALLALVHPKKGN